MSRKLSLIPLAIIVIVGAVWASSSLMIPDSPGFPARPSTPGTLAHVLDTYFRADGTALDSDALGGIDSSNYLKGVNCGFGEVWRAIDATSGTAVCMGPPLAFAQIMSGSMTINGTLRNPGYIIKEGDRIVTDATQTGTIRFTHVPNTSGTFTTDDISLARIGTGSSVYITRGDTAGTLALVELEEGLLWGRVLTSTGINFGGGGIVAGVRGTSIAMEKIADNLEYRIVVPHSQSTGDANDPVAKVAVKNPPPGYPSLEKLMGTGSIFLYDSGSIYSPTALEVHDIERIDRVALYETAYTDRRELSKWISKNTVLDLDYMIKLKTVTINPDKQNFIEQEIVATEPVRGTSDDPCRKGGDKVWYDRDLQCVWGYADYTKAVALSTNSACGTKDAPATPLYFRTGTKTTKLINICDVNEANSNGYEIDKATETPFLHSTIQGETIKYENDIYNWFADLAGKTIMVELKDPMSSSNSIKTLLSLGSTFSVYSQLGVWRCSYGGSPCDTWLTSTSNTVSIAIPNGTTITSFIIGNNSSGGRPIMNTIKKVIIY